MARAGVLQVLLGVRPTAALVVEIPAALRAAARSSFTLSPEDAAGAIARHLGARFLGKRESH